MYTCENCNSFDLKLEKIVDNYSIYYCSNCFLSKVYPTPDIMELKEIYSGVDRNIAKGAVLGEINSFLRNSNQIINALRDMRVDPLKKHFKVLRKESNICDVGCGSGIYLASLQKLGFTNLYGIEFNSDSVELINKYFNFNKVIQGEIKMNDDFPLMELVTVYDVLEHTPNPKQVLSEINKMLKSDGFLHIRVPNYGSFWSRILRKKWLWMIPPYHLNYFTLNSLQYMIEKNGFNIIKIRSRRSGYRIAFWFLQIKKLISGNIDSFGNQTYSKATFYLINFIESIFRILYFPLSLIFMINNMDDCIEVYAQKRNEI